MLSRKTNDGIPRQLVWPDCSSSSSATATVAHAHTQQATTWHERRRAGWFFFFPLCRRAGHALVYRPITGLSVCVTARYYRHVLQSSSEKKQYNTAAP
jgi:hypothetical protein